MRDLQSVQNTTYDLIVIGGGINGAGVARDAALRGLKTILIEKGDFASGTSSWSTRLVHGGLRYLEYFEFPLVREALREREVLLQTAPHLVTPLVLTIPIYRRRSRPYWKIWAGMILYDLLSLDKTLLPHRMLPLSAFRQLFRSIEPEDLNGGAQYFDAQVAYAERLCLENILAAEAAGATILNYTEVTQLHRQGSLITHLSCRDVFSDTEFTVKGKPQVVVINTSGPWVDQVCQRGTENGSQTPLTQTRKIGGTKGSHIIVAPFPGAPETTLYVEAKSDGRPFFIVPWLGMYLIGTTDLRYQGDLDRVKADDDEVDYLLTETNGIIPNAQLSRKDIKFTYSGVRPLPYQEGKKAGSITRRHILHDHSSEGVKNMISLIGGKLTTYRHVAEEMVDAAYKKLRKSAPKCPTLDKPLPGCILPDDPRVQQAVTEYQDTIPLATINYLFSIYGARTIEVLELTQKYPELAEPICDRHPDIKAQILFAVKAEFAKTFVDIARRRTVLSMQGNYALDLLSVFSEVLQKYGDWSPEDCDRATVDYTTYMKENCIPDFELSS